MTVSPKYDTFVMHEDVMRELERLRSFGIDAEVEMFPTREFSEDVDFKAVAWFGREDKVWTVRLTPDASVDEHWHVLRRMWDAITHPGHSIWDGREYGDPLWVGSPKDLAQVNRTDSYFWREEFERLLSEKVSDLIRREFSKMTPEVAALRWQPAIGRHDDLPAERFVDYRFLESHAAEVAAEIRAEMARQMRRVEDLSAAIDLSVPTVRKSLKGTRPVRPRELKAICDFLDVDVEDLIAKPYREAERAGLIFDPTEDDQ